MCWNISKSVCVHIGLLFLLLEFHNSITKSSFISLAHISRVPTFSLSWKELWRIELLIPFSALFVLRATKTKWRNSNQLKTDYHHKSVEFLNKWPYQKALNLVQPTRTPIFHVSWFVSLAFFLPIILRYSVDIKNQCPAHTHTYTHAAKKRKNTTGKCFHACGRRKIEKMLCLFW